MTVYLAVKTREITYLRAVEADSEEDVYEWMRRAKLSEFTKLENWDHTIEDGERIMIPDDLLPALDIREGGEL